MISSGGINKLDVYRGLGVREVWFWYQGAFHIYVLGAQGYELRPASELIPSLDFALVATFAEDVDQLAALKRYQQVLRG